MKNYTHTVLLIAALGFISCDVNNELDPIPEVVLPEVAFKKGSADFSKYVAVGASFTAGFTDNALFTAAQENSFPNILASKFANVGGGAFNQPLMNDNIGGLLFDGNVIAGPRLYFNGEGPAPLSETPTTESTTVLTGGPFNNMGVPGAKSFHLGIKEYGNSNPYFGRMASSSAASILADIITQSPTFFTLSEIGGNDVLGYATSGGSGVDQTGNLDPTTYGISDITDPNVFASVFSGMIDALTANEAKGVVANIPYVTSLAHFTTVPYNAVPLDEATAETLNRAFAAYNGGLAVAEALVGTELFSAEEVAKRTIVFAAGQNAIVIEDESLTDLGAINPQFAELLKYRQATPDDLFVLPSSSFIGTTVGENPLLINGVSVPLEDKWVLTPEEQNNIKVATDAYNVTIEAVAKEKGLAFVDFKTLLIDAAANGYVFDDSILTTDLVTGGLISLDGVHLTGRGYAMMANEMLKAIDETYGSNFAEATNGLAKAEDYPTNYSPSLK